MRVLRESLHRGVAPEEPRSAARSLLRGRQQSGRVVSTGAVRSPGERHTAARRADARRQQPQTGADQAARGLRHLRESFPRRVPSEPTQALPLRGEAVRVPRVRAAVQTEGQDVLPCPVPRWISRQTLCVSKLWERLFKVSAS